MVRMKTFQLICALLALIEISIVESRLGSVVKHDAEDKCGNRGIYFSLNNGWCCKCNASQYKHGDCRFGYPLETECKDCTFDPDEPNNQTYTTSSNNETECQRSFNQSTCEDIRNTHWVIGSPTSPSKCICNKGFYSTPERLMNDGCNKHSPCEPGYEPSIIGTETSNTRCRVCPTDTFSNVSSPTEKCKSFSKCEDGKVIIKAGNPTSDVQCDFPIPVTVYTTTHDEVMTSTPIATTKQSPLLPILLGAGILVLVLTIVLVRCIWKKLKGKRTLLKNDDKTSDNVDKTSDKVRLFANSARNSRSDSENTTRISENDVLLEEVVTIENSEQRPQLNSSEADGNINSSELEGTEHGSDDEITESSSEQSESVQEQAEGSVTPGLTEQILKYEGNDEFTRMAGNEEAKTREIIIELLEDHNLGYNMIESWKEYKNDDLKPVIRMFLSDTAIDDIEKDNIGHSSEIRYQWILCIRRTLSSKLTPQFLLEKSYSQQVFIDDILFVFGQKVVNKANSRT